MSVKLVALHSIWSKRKTIAPGEVFETDEKTADHLLRSGAAKGYLSEQVTDSNEEQDTAESELTLDGVALTGYEKEIIRKYRKETIKQDSDIQDNLEPATTETTTAADDSESNAEIQVDTDESLTPDSSLPYSISGVPDDTIKTLVNSGFDTVDKVKAASKEDLMKIPGLNYNLVTKIIKGAGK